MQPKKITAFLLSVMMILSLFPTVSFAASANDEQNDNDTYDTVSTDESGLSHAAREVKTMIDALPEVYELEDMDSDELSEVNDRAQDACDAFEALTDEEQGELSEELVKLRNVLGYMTTQTQPLEYNVLIKANYKNFTVSIWSLYLKKIYNVNATVSGSVLTLTFDIDWKGPHDSTTTTHTFTYTKNDYSCDGALKAEPSYKIDYFTLQFFIEKSAGHYVSNWTSSGSSKHAGTCDLCGQRVTENHTGIEKATCSASVPCSKCGQACLNLDNHTWSNGICTGCALAHDNHTWSNGTCTVCGLNCDHTWKYGQCTVCGLNCEHRWTKDGCSVCGTKCSHSYSDSMYRCSTCGYSFYGYTDRVWNDDTDELEVTRKNINDLTTLVTNQTSSMSNGWYVVEGDVTIDGNCNVYGTVHLLLCDGATLTCKRGLGLSSGNTLYVYAQSSDLDKMGKLTATAGVKNRAGIGGTEQNITCGNLIINGGIVTADGSQAKAGIGGGYYYGAGNGGNVTINGGIVTAYGGGNSAGIGGAFGGSGGNVTINGGTVIAEGDDSAAGIGGGVFGGSANVVINGGNINAIAGPGAPFGIGTGKAGISSGQIHVVSRGSIKNSKGNDLSLKTYTLVGNRTQKQITSVEGPDYGVYDTFTLDGDKLYVYLPNDAKAVTKVSIKYGQVFEPRNAGDTTLYCTHNFINGYCKYCEEYAAKNEPKLENGVYQIASLSELTWFIEQVNSGNTGLNAVLTDDIDYDEVKQGIGTVTKPYTGTFDGNGHTVKVEFGSWQYASLFPYVNGATIKNLRVDGSITTSEQNASGLVGCVSGGNVRIENCVSAVKIDSSVNGDGSHGGLAAVASGGSLTIESSAFVGKITGENTTNCGGLVGWAGTSCNINNSYVAAEFSINDANDSSYTIARNSDNANIQNCYYVNSLGYSSGAEQVDAEELSSGELAYKINGTAGVARWYQNLTNGKTVDKYPVPFDSHGAVYYCYLSCESDDIGYTNKLKTVSGHNGEEENCLKPAVCVDCGETYKEIDPTKHVTDETYYKLIDNDKHGKYHSCCHALVEEEPHSGTTADCLNNSHCDICGTSYGDKNEGTHKGTLVWVDTGYGTHEHRYTCCGAVTETQKHDLTFTADDETDVITVVCETCDGNGDYEWRNGHGTVTLNVSDKEYDGRVLDVKTVMTGFMDVYSKPAKVTVTYCCEGGCKTAGEHTVTMTVGDKTVTKTVNITKKPLEIEEIKAFSKTYDGTGDVSVNSISLHGIVVYQKGDYAVFDIKDNVAIDLSQAVITTESDAVGIYDEASISNIVLIGSDKGNYSIASSVENVVLCNTYGGDYRIDTIQVWVTPRDQTVFGDEKISQTLYTLEGLDEELYTLSGLVLCEADGKITVDGEGVKITLKDTDTDVTKYFDITYFTANALHYCANHTFDENGFCATGECDSYEEATLNDNGTPDYEWDDYYEIETAGQLYWFAKQVNDYGKTDVGAKLMKDIAVNTNPKATDARAWTPIANDGFTRFNGKFVGDGHTISGLYCKDTDGYVGLFGRMGYNYVTDLHIKNSYFEGKYAGALAGGSEGYFERCTVGDDVTVVGTDRTGGIIGTSSDGSLTNCYSTATVSGGVWGGLIGYSCARITNCYTTAMQPVGDVNKSYGGSFTNVYYAKDTRDYSGESDETLTYKPTFEGAYEIEDFATGEAAYKLQEGVEEIPEQGYWDDDWENWTVEVPAYTPELWFQTIGTDKTPTMDGKNSKKVYKQINDGCPAAPDRYSNTEGLHFTAEHSYENNGFCPCGAYEPCDTGDGTADNPYLIRNGGNLYWFAEQVNEKENYDICAKLTQNITINEKLFTSDGELDETVKKREWTPISSYVGCFDGNYCRIYGLYVIDTTGRNMFGLFASLTSSESDAEEVSEKSCGTVKNLTVANSYISASQYVGAIVGQVKDADCSIINCHNSKSTVIGIQTVGGVVGYLEGTASGCTNTGSVNGSSEVGGVFGRCEGSATNCTNKGTASGNQYIGGVIGTNTGTVTNGVNLGTVTGNVNVGGVVGENGGKLIDSSNRDGEVIGKWYVGGVLGEQRSYGEPETKNCTNTAKVSGTKQWVGGVVGYAGGGTVSGCSNLGGTVTAETSYYVGGVVGYNQATVTDCANICAVKGKERVGGVVGYNDGTVDRSRNSGKVAGSHRVGGVVGWNEQDKEITDCYNTGAVSGTEDIVGGVVGANFGSVTGCSNRGGEVSGESSVGGVVGTNEVAASIVSASCNTGKVIGTGANAPTVGGIVSINYGFVKSSYNLGALENPEGSVGGAVNENYGTITRCFAAATLKESSSEPFVYSNPSSISDCYYLADSETDNYSDTTFKTAEQFASGEVAWLLNGRSSSAENIWYQTIGEDAFPSFEGDTVYAYTDCGGENEAYANTETPSGTHSFTNGFCSCGEVYEKPVWNETENLFEIYNAGQLYYFAALVNDTSDSAVNAKLMRDITVNEKFFEGTTLNDSVTPRAWNPINTYCGTFDGNHHTIYGLYIASSADRLGMFTTLSANDNEIGVIKALTLANSYITGANGVGGLVANVGSGTSVTDCHVIDSVVSGKAKVGGLAAENGGSIENCTFNGTLIGTNGNNGGIVGSNNGTVSDCINDGKVGGAGYYVGGVVGANSGTVTDCRNRGAVNVSGVVSYGGGGVVGGNFGNVRNCSNSATVSGVYNVGGVVGRASTGVESCYNTGNITGQFTVGGIIGAIINHNVGARNCYNTGNITATNQGCAGGLVGDFQQQSGNPYDNISFINCYNVGTVKDSGRSVAGTLGGRGKATFTNCYYLSNSGLPAIGQMHNSMTEDDADVYEVAETDFTGGYVACKLQGEQEEPVWGQILGTDKYPVLGGPAVYWAPGGTFENYITESKILGIGADQKSANVYFAKLGTYTVIFTHYEKGRLDKIVSCEVTAENLGTVNVTSDAMFTLGRGDTVLVWNKLSGLKPICEKYIVK